MRKINHNKYTSAWPVVKRHWFTAYRHLNLKKFGNLVVAYFEYKAGKVNLRSQPYFIKIEPTNACNLSCPGCIHGQELPREEMKKGKMDFELFKKIIDGQKDYLIKASLYSMGEPFLHPDILKMIKYLTDSNIGSVVSSNLNVFSGELAKGIVENKLSHLIVCLDGCSEEEYKKYRRGGELEKVKNNLKLIQEEKEKQNSEFPMIEIQAINLPHLKTEDIARIEKMAKEIGADIFSLKEDLRKSYDNPQPENKRCFWLYGNPQIKFDGTIEPCCFYYNDDKSRFGDTNVNSLPETWNNEKFRAAREYFKTGRKTGNALKCYECIFFKKTVGKDI